MQFYHSGTVYMIYLFIIANHLDTQKVCFAQNANGLNPKGCEFLDPTATCDFSSWDPPLDFGTTNSKTLHSVIVENVDGAIPAQAFDGLDGPQQKEASTEAYFEFDCSSKDINLTVNSFTANLDWLQSMYFRLCYFQSGLPSNVFDDLVNLEKLEITGGGIPGSIHVDSLSGLDSLIELTINADFPGSLLPSGFLSGVPSVEIVSLKSSGLAKMSADAFAGLYYIKTLDLSANSLPALLDGILDDMSFLEDLDLSGNLLSTLPQDLFIYATDVKTLDISRNALTSLPSGIFDPLVLLETLDLSANSLSTLPSGLFNFSTALDNIDLSQNSLTSLPSGLFDFLINLQTLDLSDNNLTSLPENLFNPLISISSISLTNNLWDCSCGLNWISIWSMYTGIDHNIVCSTPAAYSGLVLERVMLALDCPSILSTGTSTSGGTSGTSTGGVTSGTNTGGSGTTTLASGGGGSGTTTTSDSNSASNSDSTSDSSSSSPTLWETLTISLSAGAALLSALTVVGTCVALNKMKTSGQQSMVSDLYDSETPAKLKGRRLFSRATVHSRGGSDVQPYVDVRYNHRF